MMSNRSTDILFQLVKSLEKAEKRHFKLYIKRSSSRQDLKIIQLFDAIDKARDYNEQLILKKIPGVEKPQLANLKAGRPGSRPASFRKFRHWSRRSQSG